MSPVPHIRRVRPDDYEPWLAEMIESGEVEPPDEFVIDDPPTLPVSPCSETNGGRD